MLSKMVETLMLSAQRNCGLKLKPGAATLTIKVASRRSCGGSCASSRVAFHLPLQFAPSISTTSRRPKPRRPPKRLVAALSSRLRLPLQRLPRQRLRLMLSLKQLLLRLEAGCPLQDFCKYATGFLNSDGHVYLLDAQLLVASALRLKSDFPVPFGATLKVTTLNRITVLLSEGMHNMTPPRSKLALVDATAVLVLNLRPQPVLNQHDFDFPTIDAARPSDQGLATLFDANSSGAPGTLRKFFQAQCIVGGAGFPQDRQHTHNRALAILDADTFGRLPSASFRSSARPDSLPFQRSFPDSWSSNICQSRSFRRTLTNSCHW